MPDESHPTHDLENAKTSVRVGFVTYRMDALDGAVELELDRQDIADCLCALTPDDFYKTMPADNWPGCMQDVYRPTYKGIPIYLKFQLFPLETKRFHLVSFKRDTKR
jgi:hypothetical protein